MPVFCGFHNMWILKNKKKRVANIYLAGGVYSIVIFTIAHHPGEDFMYCHIKHRKKRSLVEAGLDERLAFLLHVWL